MRSWHLPLLLQVLGALLSPWHRATRSLISPDLAMRCMGTATPLAPSPSLPLSTACAAWWGRTSPSTR